MTPPAAPALSPTPAGGDTASPGRVPALLQPFRGSPLPVLLATLHPGRVMLPWQLQSLERAVPAVPDPCEDSPELLLASAWGSWIPWQRV